MPEGQAIENSPPAKRSLLGRVLAALVPVLKDAFDKRDQRIQGLVVRVDELSQRVIVLEQRPAVKYCGIHVSGRTYAEGSLCTRSGSLWLATRETAHAPGDPESWKLIVKRGDA